MYTFAGISWGSLLHYVKEGEAEWMLLVLTSVNRPPLIMSQLYLSNIPGNRLGAPGRRRGNYDANLVMFARPGSQLS